jgi:hypothetical protein
MHRTIKEEGVLAMLGEDMNEVVDQPLVWFPIPHFCNLTGVEGDFAYPPYSSSNALRVLQSTETIHWPFHPCE